jgi:Pyruvate/2-oxoacid:ferredoxin oxidoreductase delta subunit
MRKTDRQTNRQTNRKKERKKERNEESKTKIWERKKNETMKEKQVKCDLCIGQYSIRKEIAKACDGKTVLIMI